MSYLANQYNYATPLSSVSNLGAETTAVVDARYFTLFDNVLDGSYVPITGDVGLWGNVLSDSSGNLATPFVLTINDLTSKVQNVRVTGSSACYPVDFTVTLYKGANQVGKATKVDNTSAQVTVPVPSSEIPDRCVISITKISAANSVARLYNVYKPTYIMGADTLAIELFESKSNVSGGSNHMTFKSRDTVPLKLVDNTHVTNRIDKTYDEFVAGVIEQQSHVTNKINTVKDTLSLYTDDAQYLRNVHSIMKEPSRRVYGKVYITYTDPMLDAVTTIESSSEAYNGTKDSILESVETSDLLYFTLYDNDLSGRYTLLGEHDHIGWVSQELSSATGEFDNPLYLKISFVARPISSLSITFDSVRNIIAREFKVTFVTEPLGIITHHFKNNFDTTVDIMNGAEVENVVSIKIEIIKISKPFSPAIITSLPVSSTLLYKGYSDVSNLMSIDLLEELTYEDEVEALGGVSANEITVVLDNSTKEFTHGSGTVVSRHLRRNRKIVPWLGVEVLPGEIEWYTLGTFWSYKWDVPTYGLTASVVGFDTIGLLSNTDFTNHHMQIYKSVGQLIEYVLADATKILSFLEYDIDPALYDIVIPYAWFDRGTHAAALRKISMCYPMHIYCDRDGRICAKPQKLRLDYFTDVWANDTNVIDKKYSSLYTVLPNIVNVTVNRAVPEATELARDENTYAVNDSLDLTLTFNAPYVSNIVVEVTCDEGITYTYEVYSWGLNIAFAGEGKVYEVRCTGKGLNTDNKTVVTRSDDNSVLLNGSVTRNITSDFIQTNDLANVILDRLFSLSDLDKFDVSVDYRGDIALSINDPIILKDGIAPDDRYNIKRHELHWNGSLTGSADLNT